MNQKILITIFITLSLTLTMIGFAQASSKSSSPKSGTLEPLYGLSFSSGNVEILVTSNGCTKAEHFELKSKKVEGQKLITIEKIKKDRCRAMPKIITVRLKFNDMSNGDIYDIGNRFLVVN